MDAFERFLAVYPDWRGKVTYLQITPKSRSEIQEYAEMERPISSAAGRINGAYGEAAWTPIRYVNRAYSRTALAGLYRAARAGAGDAAARRHEPRGQGIRRGAGSGRSGRADPVALRRSGGRAHRGAAGQSVRPRGGGERRSRMRSRCRSRSGANVRGAVPGDFGERYQVVGRAVPGEP